MALKVTKKEITIIEAYLGTFAASVGSLYIGGNHNVKNVLWSALVAVFGPVYVKAKAYLAKNSALVSPLTTPSK